MDKNQLAYAWVAVIAGEQGVRAPLSYAACPRQFRHLDSHNTFIQATCKRFIDFGIKPARIVIIVANKDQFELTEEQLTPLGILPQNICIIEPEYGYVGAAIKAKEFIEQHDKKATIIITPSDQFVVSNDEFKRTLEEAIKSALDNETIVITNAINNICIYTGKDDDINEVIIWPE